MGMDVTIGEDFARFVERKVASGEFASAREVVEHALRILESDDPTGDEQLAWLRPAWNEGIASGNVGPLSADDLKHEARRRRATKA